MKMLLAVDGSACALEAVKFAIALVRDGLQARFVLATVQEPTCVYEMVLAPDAEVLERVTGATGERALEAAEAMLEAASVAFDSEIGSGMPADALVEMVKRFACDAVIIGARGHGVLRSALLGSVSQAVLHASPVPVTIVKPSSS
ncbi:universal stress protein [Methylibium sp.]|uniref:universal stress protein n=1 Tax=Methylibium sp. TaxID=2067992 RepID=UPI003D13A906